MKTILIALVVFFAVSGFILAATPTPTVTPTPSPTVTPTPSPTASPARVPYDGSILGVQAVFGQDDSGNYHILKCSSNGVLWTLSK